MLFELVVEWTLWHRFIATLNNVGLKTDRYGSCGIQKCSHTFKVYFDYHQIQYSSTVQYLGLIFDKTLNWRAHTLNRRARWNCCVPCNSPLAVSHLLFHCKLNASHRASLQIPFIPTPRGKIESVQKVLILLHHTHLLIDLLDCKSTKYKRNFCLTILVSVN